VDAVAEGEVAGVALQVETIRELVASGRRSQRLRIARRRSRRLDEVKEVLTLRRAPMSCGPLRHPGRASVLLRQMFLAGRRHVRAV
jgi:hypothetical protein